MIAARLTPGLWSVLPTPFRAPGLAVDTASLARLTAALAGRSDVHGLVALGVFGESAQLTPAERADVVRTVVAAGAGRPLVIGITGTDTVGCASAAAELAGLAGPAAPAVMVQVNSAEPGRLRAHLQAVHDGCGAGIVVQDYPVITGVTIAPRALAEAIRGLPFVAAIKSESPPTGAVIAALTARVDVPVFGGLGGLGLLDELLAGAAGAMTGFSFPDAIAAALAGWRQGGFPAARAAYAPWLPLVNFEAQPGIGLSVRKHILCRRGLIDDAAVRPPARPMPPELDPILAAHLAATAAVSAAGA
ncbi:MAG TPA: dihydrodipicolinate synthase family protein [Mycobacteriales bacterium]|nr:dihydrodipicolinate synthase family protein [Mycobacteriales bacterium]